MIDKNIGMRYCNNVPKIYSRILTIFCQLRPEKQLAMEEAILAEDWARYVVGIHALKTNVRNIGGTVLDEKALALELTGKRYLDEETPEAEKPQLLDFIRTNHPEAMKLYDEMAQEAAAIIEELAQA